MLLFYCCSKLTCALFCNTYYPAVFQCNSYATTTVCCEAADATGPAALVVVVLELLLLLMLFGVVRSFVVLSLSPVSCIVVLGGLWDV